jgi:hypothetical protein
VLDIPVMRFKAAPTVIRNYIASVCMRAGRPAEPKAGIALKDKGTHTDCSIFRGVGPLIS